ncbi:MULTISPECIES: AraC family transcriptional regulator [unclassified Microcoleus]|uniref:AraC family transcriptional regulator n=1 Tax=unclassified Microcoleus TaxID=2642155 RepID=UPI002FD4907C
MSEGKVLFVDSNQENHFSEIFPQFPIIKSDRTIWTGISLEYHRQPPFETTEYAIGSHMIAINLGQSFQLERKIDRRWETSQVLPGAIGLCPFNLSHEMRWHSEMNLLSLNLEHEFLVRSALELFNTEQVELLWPMAFQDPLIQQIGLALKAEAQSDGGGSRLYAETMANALAVHLLRHYSTQGTRNFECKGGMCPHKLRWVQDYINDYLEREFGLDELAALAQLSPYHFSRAFKQSVGISPHQYVIQQRVERAKQLLLQGNMSLSEIAIACGFSHQSHLTRHFKRLTGVTPKTLLKS